MKTLSFLCLALFCSLHLAGEELIGNRDFSQVSDGVPAGWQYNKQSSEFAPAFKLEGKVLTMTGSSINCVGGASYHVVKNCPAGTTITLSGEYKTNALNFGTNGSVFVSSLYRNNQQVFEEPRAWLNAALKPVEEWTAFKETFRLPFATESAQVNLAMNLAEGSVSFRNISLTAEAPRNVYDKSKAYAWREAEDIEKIKQANPFGGEIQDYFSGRGGTGSERGKFDWKFNIPEIVDEETLFAAERIWHVWIRAYGYLDRGRIMIFNNEKFMNYLDVPNNEKYDKNGKYAGPGHYSWLYCGKFSSKGGPQQLSFQPKARMLLDALLLTTDEKYAPVKFEAKNFPQERVIDFSTKHAIKAEYQFEGITDSISLPISFRIGGESLVIPADGKAAVFHFSLPDYIKVDGVTSHWAGESWTGDRWHDRFLTWKKIGSHMQNIGSFNDYEAYLYYLSSNQYMIFCHADKSGFKPGKKSVCSYYLEHDGETQPVEKILLKHTAIMPTTPFKKIYIGPAYVPLEMMYFSYPEVFKNMSAAGLNYMGSWVDDPWKVKGFDAFRDAAHANNFMLSCCVPLYTGHKPEHAATGIDGKPILDVIPGHDRTFTLSMDENDAPIKNTLELTRRCAASGISIEYDDEAYNCMWDIVDYTPKTKQLFQEWLAKNHPQVTYKEPELIVKERMSDKHMYDLWVDFKCSRVNYWYSLYRKAFDQGLAEAKGKYPEHMKPILMTCIQSEIAPRDGGKQTARTTRESNFADYSELNKYCDLIEMMLYTYQGVPQSAKPARAMELYNRYLGRNNTVPILLAGGYGTEVMPENKVMLKYQVLECLMEKPKIIVFYAGATLFNAPTLAPVTEAIRIARPYEEFFVEGQRYTAAKCSAPYVLTRGLKLGGKVLLYAGNYTHPADKAVTITLPGSVKSVLDCESNQEIPVNDSAFDLDFQSSRGRMFLVQ